MTPKVEAILQKETPKDQSELSRFLGMVNQLSKFQPQIAELSKPLRDLLSTKNHWSWSEAQDNAFSALKRSLTTTPTLEHYDARRQTTLSTDASSYGLGAVLLQKQDDEQWRPVAYASRAMNPTEQRYAQIEKEALDLIWASERFADYLIGLKYHIETGPKPLVPLLSTKNLEDRPARVQRFRMRMMRFSYAISHIPGKSLCTADALSRKAYCCLCTVKAKNGKRNIQQRTLLSFITRFFYSLCPKNRKEKLAQHYSGSLKTVVKLTC